MNANSCRRSGDWIKWPAYSVTMFSFTHGIVIQISQTVIYEPNNVSIICIANN